MDALRKAALVILDKIEALLKSEPARLIGYGSAGIVMLVVYIANLKGITKFGANLNFDDAVALTLGALGFLTVVVESIRRFVYSPQTYIEDLADESKRAHEQAHFEEELGKMLEATAAQSKKRVAVVGTAKPADSTNKPD